MTTCQNAKQSETIIIDKCTFEVVQTFTHLGSSANCNNDINQEIKKLTSIANNRIYGLNSQLKSHILSWKSKIILYKAVMGQS
jgi:hypothetical protein